MCQLGENVSILAFGRYTCVVSRWEYRAYEYTILDSHINGRRYGKVFSSCQYSAEDMKQAISVACASVAQRAADDVHPDTELLAAILSYCTAQNAAQFHDWRSQKALVNA